MAKENMEKQWGVWIFRSILMILIAIGAWFAQQIWHGQEHIVNRLNSIDIERASFLAGSFTMSDWVKGKTAIDAQFNINDRRIFKLETASEQITKSLDRIEFKLGTIK